LDSLLLLIFPDEAKILGARNPKEARYYLCYPIQ